MRIGQERGCPPKPNGNSRPAEDSKARNLSGELCFSHGEITWPIPGKANFPGEQLGFEYEVAKEFAKSLGVRLEIVIPPSREALLEYLATGKGDLIAAGMTRTPEREKSFAFSAPYQFVSELLIVPAKDTTTHGLSDLKGKTVSVRKSSSYYETLSNFKDNLGFKIDLLPEDLETEEITGKIPATVADSNIVQLELTYKNKIRSAGPLGDVVEIGWVMRKGQRDLKTAIDAFITKLYKATFYNLMVSKYFKDAKRTRTDQKLRADKGGRLSPYDDLVKKHSRTYEFDWRLITSQMYQESGFDPKVKSWVGAKRPNAGDAAHGTRVEDRRCRKSG